MRTRPGWVEPDIYFRIVHVAGDGHHSAPMAAYREQRVEIALGPKGAFDNGNIGALTRRVSGDRTVSAVLQVRGNPKPPRGPQTPRVAELLRKAIEWRRQLDTGEVRGIRPTLPAGRESHAHVSPKFRVCFVWPLRSRR